MFSYSFVFFFCSACPPQKGSAHCQSREVIPAVGCFTHELEEVAVWTAACLLLLLVIEDALAERQAGATNVHHVIEVVDDLVYFAVVVSCIAC